MNTYICMRLCVCNETVKGSQGIPQMTKMTLAPQLNYVITRTQKPVGSTSILLGLALINDYAYLFFNISLI